MKRLELKPYLTFGLLFASTLGIVALGSLTGAFAQESDQEFRRICRQRNVLQGCDCDCDAQVSSLLRCPTGGTQCSEGFGSTASAGAPAASSGVQLVLFPSLEDGIIANENGQLQTDQTIYNVTSLVLIALIVVAIGVTILGGIQFANAGGDDEKLEQARKTLLGGVVGLALVFVGLIVGSLVAQSFGLTSEFTVQEGIDSTSNPTPDPTFQDLTR